MASSRILVNICRKCQILFTQAASTSRSWVPRIGHKFATKSIVATPAIVAFCKAKQVLDLQAPDSAFLEQEYLLKSSSALTADSATTLLTRAAVSLTEAQARYRDMVNNAMYLMEYHVTVLDNEDEAEKTLETLEHTREWIEKYDQYTKDIELLLSHAEQVANASAEVAYLLGSEFSSSSLGERVHHTRCHVDRCYEESRKMAKQLTEVETLCNEAIAKHMEKVEKRNILNKRLLLELKDQNMSEQDVFEDREVDRNATKEPSTEKATKEPSTEKTEEDMLI